MDGCANRTQGTKASRETNTIKEMKETTSSISGSTLPFLLEEKALYHGASSLCDKQYFAFTTKPATQSNYK